MDKKRLDGLQMSDLAYVEQAASWSRDLTRMKTRGPGDIENAMRAVERDYGIAYSTLWALRYRKDQLKDIGVSIYERLAAAYRSECERQARRLAHEIAITKAVEPTHPYVAEAEAALGEDEELRD